MKSTADIWTEHRQRSGKGHMPKLTSRQSGLTLIELIIALAIISLIAGVTVVAIDQLLRASRQANDQQYAVSQVRQAEHWITRDVFMAWRINASGFPLILYWEHEDEHGNTFSHDVEYSLVGPDEDSQEMQRFVTVKDVTDRDNPLDVDDSSLVIARGLVNSNSETSCAYDVPDDPDDMKARILTVTLVARAGTHEELRVFEAKPRKTHVEVIEST